MNDQTTHDKITKGAALLCLWVCIMFTGVVRADADSKIGTFTIIRGSVDAMHEQQNSPVPVLKDSDALLNDVIRTKRRSRARLSFTDGSVLNMGTNHMIHLKKYVYDQKKDIRHVVVSALRGSLRATVSKFTGDSTFAVETPSAVVSVRGTDFLVTVGSDGITTVTVISGVVEVKNEFGMVTLKAGQQTIAVKGQAPSTPVQIPAAMMNVLMDATKVEAAKSTTQNSKPRPSQAQGHTALPSTTNTMPIIPTPKNLFQRVQTGASQDRININQNKTNNPATSRVFAPPPITQTVTNLQGCPPGTLWKQGSGTPAGPNVCTVGGSCAGVGSVCGGGTCLAGPPGPNVCTVGGGACAPLAAACGAGTCIAGPPLPNLCSSDGSLCASVGAACGTGICNAGTAAILGVWACQ